jgi:plasmid stabilization system protein ParE
MMELIVLLQAEIDIQSAFSRYEGYQSDRGIVFLQRLDAALNMVRLHPHIGRFYDAPFRRMLLRDFPYGIFYEVQAGRIVVAAVLDLRRDPDAIGRRLSGLSEEPEPFKVDAPTASVSR